MICCIFRHGICTRIVGCAVNTFTAACLPPVSVRDWWRMLCQLSSRVRGFVVFRVINSREIYFPEEKKIDSIRFRSYYPIGLPNVLVVAIVWPPTVSWICLSLALLLCNHHRGLRRIWSVFASQLNCRFIPSPSQPQTRARVWVSARVGHGSPDGGSVWPVTNVTPATPCSWRVWGYALIYWVKRD